MKQFADETAIGKKIKTDLQLLSNSWFVDDKINLQEGVTAFSVITGPFVSAVGEEAVILAQQRGALDYKSLSKGKTVTDISTLQDELEWLHFEWLNVKDRVSALAAQEIRRLEDLRQVALSYAAFYRKDVVPEDVLKFLDDEEGDDETQDDYEMQEDGDEIQDDAEEG
ncbi:hypothetical protein OUZ56_010158 [Daphnia magna]|uniref:Uncharacterized protein n=1 Tax=Daphnia magna TaxID=35525 RepID=A0ABR0AHZ0_9CRUS|nr:hypothetical protein OUZ56_010158 [Daphnia magna]